MAVARGDVRKAVEASGVGEDLGDQREDHEDACACVAGAGERLLEVGRGCRPQTMRKPVHRRPIRCLASATPIRSSELAKLESTCYTFHYGKRIRTSHTHGGGGFSSAERR
jgi:hypothetical protein